METPNWIYFNFNHSTQNRKSLQDDASVQKLSAGLERTMEVLVSVAAALVLWKGVQLVLSGAVTPGDLLIGSTLDCISFSLTFTPLTVSIMNLIIL